MSDPSLVLRPALAAWLRTDTEVMAAFGSKQVKVLQKIPVPNDPKPYVFLAGFSVDDDIAECLDATQVELQIDVWSLTSPPGFAEAATIAGAVKASIFRLADDGNSPPFSIAGFRVVAVEPLSTDYLTDPSDGATVHAVIRIRLSIDPV